MSIGVDGKISKDSKFASFTGFPAHVQHGFFFFFAQSRYLVGTSVSAPHPPPIPRVGRRGEGGHLRDGFDRSCESVCERGGGGWGGQGTLLMKLIMHFSAGRPRSGRTELPSATEFDQ